MREIDKYQIPPSLSKRVRLSEEQKREIRELYRSGGRTWQSLAVDYNVSATLIGRIVNPDYAHSQDDQHKAKDYYDKEATVARNKKHVIRKKRLLREGKLLLRRFES